MLRLLDELPQWEYPGDYLLSRLRSRMVAMVIEDHAGAEESIAAKVSDAGVWGREMDGRRWLFRQMNHGLRRATAPFFFYFEIKTLVRCLRYREGGRFEAVEPLVDRSLLSAGVKKIMLAKASTQEIVGRLERFFHASPLPVKGLSDVYREKGVQGCEEKIRMNFFAQTLRSGPDHIARSFFQHFVALSNTLTFAKCQRWNKEVTPPLAVDGAIGTRFLSLPVSEDRLRLMISHLTREKAVPADHLHPLALEPVLYATLLLQLSRNRREGEQVAACIEYLLRSHFVAKNRSILLHKRRWKTEKPITEERIR